MSKWRKAAKNDTNQKTIVEELKAIPGFSVVTGMDDILVGFQGKTLWVEIKNEFKYSKKTGKILESAKQKSQKKLDITWTGARIYARSSKDILEWFWVSE